MNNYNFTIKNDDVAITPVENIFINHYMPRAKGDYVKVYLFGLKHCFNRNLAPMDNAALAELFDITEGDVIRAWEYWEKEGILTLEYKGTKDVIVTYQNITASFIPQKSEPLPEPKDPLPADNERHAHMIERIQGMYGSRTISHQELLLFNEWLTDYHFTPETLILLAEYSLSMIEKKDAGFTAKQITNYMSTVAEVWYKAGIRDYNEANTFIEQGREMQKLHYDVFRYLGLNRQPIKWEKELMDKWIQEYHYDMAIITCALERSSKPNLRYIDGILKRWHEKGYTSVEEIRAEPRPTGKTTGAAPAAADPFDKEREAAYEAFDSEWIRSIVDE